MSEYIHLVGAESVQSAGNTMKHAAEDMNRAASSFADSVFELKRSMDDWLTRLEDIVVNKTQR
jgi:hypothetical protein